MRIERQHGADGPTSSGLLARELDETAVAAMHSVEIADGDDGTAQSLGDRILGPADGEAGRIGAWPS
jgi:hypothetical protein